MFVCLFIYLFIYLFIIFSVPSEAPANFAGRNTSATSLAIEWRSIPQEFIHGILLGYKIFYRRTSEPNVPYQTLTVPPEELRKKLTELLKYTEYCTKVAGYTRRGDGKSTECLNITTAQESKRNAIRPISTFTSCLRIKQPIRILKTRQINQLELKANTRKRRRARENRCIQVSTRLWSWL